MSRTDATLKARGDGGDRGAGVPETLELTEIFNILGNSRRQHIIRRLGEEGKQTKRQLAQSLYAVEEGVCPEECDPSSEDLNPYYVSIKQGHQPKLEWAGVVEERHKYVHPGPNFEVVLRALNGGILSTGVDEDLVGDVGRPSGGEGA